MSVEFSERPGVINPRVAYNDLSAHKWTYTSPANNLLPVVEQKQNMNWSRGARGGNNAMIAEENMVLASGQGKGYDNDVMLLEYCVWRWKWSLCFLLFFPYWIASLFWDYKSAENRRNDPEEIHYSSWLINTVFAIVVVYLLCNMCRKRFCRNLNAYGQDSQGRVCRPDLWLLQNVLNASEKSQSIMFLIAMGFWIFWILIECGLDLQKWQCVLGLSFFILLSIAISCYPTKINWRPVVWGFFLQWILGWLVLKTDLGFLVFGLLSDLITTFLNYSNLGSTMVFGSDFFDYFTFAYRIMPTVIFFSATVSVLYYLGIFQIFITGISWFMKLTFNTSEAESFAAVGSIFIGQTEAALLIGPYLNTMTRSEINTVMTSGFATVSGSALMLYAMYGIEIQDLLAAAAMSAPAAIAISKIICPEMEYKNAAPKQREVEVKASNLLDAITTGALRTIMIVANTLVLLIAFMGALEFADGCVGYLGERVGLVEDDKLSFIKLCGWLLYPICWLMGAPGEDCFQMGELLGYKIFASELVAYKEMICFYEDNSIGIRSVYTATYALSGFSSFGAIGIQIGGLLPLAPERKQEVIGIAVRAMIAGNIACFMTACVGGILMDKEPIQKSFNLDCSE